MGGGTPLSTRWAQMDQQRRELERRKQLYLQRQQHQATAPPASSQNTAVDSTPSLNAFSNDGSFLDKFKQLSGNKTAPKLLKTNKIFPKHDASKKNDKFNEKDGKSSHQDKHKRDSNYHHNRDRSRSSSRGRDKKHDRKFKNDKNNFRDHKYNRWESNNRGSRRRSFSPCTPVVEDMPHRKSSKFANILPTSVSKSSSFPATVSAPNLSNNLNNYQQHSNPQINLPVFPDQVLNSVAPKQINLNLPPITNPIINVQVPPPITVPPPNVIPVPNNPNFNNTLIPPNLPNTSQNNVHYPSYNEVMPINNTYLPPPNVPNPIFNIGNTAVPPPILNDRIPHLPPPITNVDNLVAHIPLHAIPEPKPIDMISIPPPKPLDTIAIPPPKPLDAITIPPPKPMNLHTIPPPLPICLTQIPKPKELDLHSIPHPPMSVLSTDGCLSASMEATAKQVAQNGDAWELTLKAQNAKADTWFLHDTKSEEYKLFRSLVLKYRNENDSKYNEKESSNDDKYEPEFSLRDDSSSEDEKIEKAPINKENQSNSTSYPIRLHFEKSKNEQKDLSALNKFKNDLDNDSDSDNSVKKKKKDSGKKKKSRWGDSTVQPPAVTLGLPGVAAVTTLGGVINVNVPTLPPKAQPQLTRITRQDPGLLQYAIKTYGTVNLDEEDWKKCEDHYKISILYQEMLTKRREIEKLTASGRFKYEYDSDEEIDENGTWEHRLRQQEMEATQRWACELTRQASGKHHIGDFLPPDELKKFMEKYSSAKSGKEPDLSDYKEYKLKEDNIGFKMLQKLGWSEGEGLGADRSGIVDPVNKATQRDSNHGLGVERADNVAEGDDEFDAYRKRMMLAYRFRPNPLNNPRRPYY